MKSGNFPRTWVEINTVAIRHNCRVLRSSVSKQTQIMAVVKANAYGHGIVDFSKQMEKNNIAYLGVFEYNEAVLLRKSGVRAKILVLGYMSSQDLEKSARDRIEVTISNLQILNYIAHLKNKINIHLKVDTGLGRQGFLIDELSKVIAILQKSKHITVVGLYSHLAVADNPKRSSYTLKQYECLLQWQRTFHDAGFDCITHIGASSVALARQYGEFQMDMVRIGVAQYGLWPSEDIRRVSQGVLLKPVLSWKTRISEIKKVKKGSKLGYDLTKTVTRDSVIAILPVGYWDGYPRSLSNKGYVIIKGKRAEVLGRVCMNMCVVDVTNVPGVKSGDVVYLIGGTKGNQITVDTLAQLAGTIPYELVTRINPLIDRMYI